MNKVAWFTQARRQLLHCQSLMVLAALSLGGCASIEPWVKPYERNNLADVTMNWELDPVANSYMHHVFQARESARGAEGSSGGGCGCN